MTQLKKIAFVAFLAITLAASTLNAKATIEMTQQIFIEKVTDFKTNPSTWKYLGDKPCLIDFYTTWCGPCKRLAPILEELAEEYKGEIYIYKVDTEREPALARLFQVSSIPTLLFCPMDGAPQINKGALPKEILIQAIDKVLLNKVSLEKPEPAIPHN